MADPERHQQRLQEDPVAHRVPVLVGDLENRVVPVPVQQEEEVVDELRDEQVELDLLLLALPLDLEAGLDEVEPGLLDADVALLDVLGALLLPDPLHVEEGDAGDRVQRRE